MIKSPVDQKSETTLVREIPVEEIKSKYLKEYGFDAKRYFDGLESVEVRRCNKTGYEFYYPYSLQGREDLYQCLQAFEFYYLSDRWEFSQVAQMMKKNEKLLEIGCGRGDALAQFKKKGALVKGLELNSDALKVCQKKGFNIEAKDYGEYAIRHQGEFDVVCAFHLLEHLSDVNRFFVNALRLLKKGGRIYISVPNNASFGHVYNTLNLPPHHMGLWDEISFKKLEEVFDFRLSSVKYTPLEEGQKSDLEAILKKNLEKRSIGIRSMSRFPKLISSFISEKKKGYTILVEFTKL